MTLRNVAIAAFIVLCAASMHAPAQSPSAPAVKQLRALIEKGDFESAAARLESLQLSFEKDFRQEKALGDALFACYAPGEKLAAALDAWVSASRASYVARLCRGLHWTATGFERRGDKARAQTTIAQIAGMSNAFVRAYLDYRRALELSSKPTFAYWGLITIGRALGLDQRALRGLLDQAIAAEPNTSNVRLAYLAALRPEWGGSLEEMAAFIEETRRTHPQVQRIDLMEANLADARASLAVRQRDATTAVAESDRAVQLAKTESTLRRRAWAHFMAKNYDQAIADANEALAQDDCHPCAIAIRGMARVRSGRHAEGLEDLRSAAENDNATAQNELGMAYAFGRYGLARDYAAAEKWCRKAAEQRDSIGAYCLGGLYFSGLGVPRDAAQAAKWYELSAALGLADAQADLGIMYLRGVGVTKNEDAAVKLLKLAAEQGNARAQSQLRQLLRK